MLNGRVNFLAGCLITGLALLSGCGERKSTPSPTVTAEKSFCSTVQTFSNPTVTISGTAKFNRRIIFDNAGTATLGSAEISQNSYSAQQKPIRLAEVVVTDSAGAIAQCTTTDDNGQFQFSIPQNSGTYTISVNSRASTSQLKVSVLNNPTSNQYYSLTGTVGSSSDSSLSLVAPANGTVLGGAFNIMDQIYRANLYLQVHTANCTNLTTDCFDVSVKAIPKVRAYWTKGFNPGEYFGMSDGISFYSPGDYNLFILGGLNGNVDSADTDHFDDSVILHEYGHFLEDAVGTSDSPGGSHDGLYPIDPRLAWSEGWGNFFQGAVRGQADYIDTKGNMDGRGGSFFNIDLETRDGLGEWTDQGEGNFMEFAVTRLLWDATDSNQDSTDTVSDSFNNIWAVFTSALYGFASSANPAANSAAATFAFRNTGLLNKVQQGLSGASNWSAIKTLNGFSGTRTPYGTPLVTSCSNSPTYSLNGTAYDFQLTPVLDNNDEFFRNNDYFYFKPTNSGNATIELQFAKVVAGNSVDPNLDIAIYNEDHELNEASTMVGYSARTNSTTESVTANFKAGNKYLIQVKARTDGLNGPGVQAYYNLKLGGSRLCSSDLVP